MSDGNLLEDAIRENLVLKPDAGDFKTKQLHLYSRLNVTGE
jgi:hypothetical protein